MERFAMNLRLAAFVPDPFAKTYSPFVTQSAMHHVIDPSKYSLSLRQPSGCYENFYAAYRCARCSAHIC